MRFVGAPQARRCFWTCADFKEVGFKIPRSNTENIGLMAVYRGKARRAKGQYGLKPLTRTVLGRHLPEEPHIRKSAIWDQKLSKDHKAVLCAANDAEAGLFVYYGLEDLPDLSIRLKLEEVEPGTDVDILPYRKTCTDAILFKCRGALDGERK